MLQYRICKCIFQNSGYVRICDRHYQAEINPGTDENPAYDIAANGPTKAVRRLRPPEQSSEIRNSAGLRPVGNSEKIPDAGVFRVTERGRISAASLTSAVPWLLKNPYTSKSALLGPPGPYVRKAGNLPGKPAISTLT